MVPNSSYNSVMMTFIEHKFIFENIYTDFHTQKYLTRDLSMFENSIMVLSHL